MRNGIVAEVASSRDLVRVLRALRELGYRELDAFSPHIIPELERLLELRRPALTWFVGAVGFGAAGTAYIVQWLCNAVWYPLNVGGRPPHSAPAFMVISFVFGILLAGVAAFYAFVKASRLPWLANPIFAADGFERASLDRYWLSIDASDPRYDPERSAEELGALGAQRVQYISPVCARPWRSS